MSAIGNDVAGISRHGSGMDRTLLGMRFSPEPRCGATTPVQSNSPQGGACDNPVTRLPDECEDFETNRFVVACFAAPRFTPDSVYQ